MNKLLLFLWPMLASSQMVFSQNNDISDTLELREVVVTHSKIPLSKKQTTKPVKIITRQQIEQCQGKDLAQVLQEEAGMMVNGAFSNPGKDKAVYTQGASNEYTLMLVDGQPIIDPSGLGGSFDLRLFSLGQIERIEILPGSQSTLYGSEAIAGVINIITRKSGDEAVGAYGAVSYGSYNSFRGNAGVNGNVKFFDYNMNVDRTSTDGFSEAREKNPTDDFDKDGSEMLSFQGNLGFKVSEKLSLRPSFRYADFGGDFDDGAFADAPNRYDAKILHPGIQAQYQGDRIYSNLSYSYTQTDRAFQTTFGLYEYKGRFHNVDVLVNYRLNRLAQFSAGMNFQDLQMLDTTSTVANPSETILSPSLNLMLRPLEKMNVEAGYRYNRHSKFGSNSNLSASLSWFFTETFKAFGTYTTGFKAPALGQLYGPFGANENLKPQTSVSWATGFELRTLQEKMELSLSFFSRKIKDGIAYDFATGYVNQNEQNDEGVEAEISWKATEGLSFQGQYFYLTGDITTVNFSGRDTTFNNLFRRPKHNFSIAVLYRPVPRLLLTVRAQRMGERTDLYFNPDNFFAEEVVTLDAYLLVNSYAEFNLLDGKLVLFSDLKNILNQDFEEAYGFNAMGFNVQSGLRFKL